MGPAQCPHGLELHTREQLLLPQNPVRLSVPHGVWLTHRLSHWGGGNISPNWFVPSPRFSSESGAGCGGEMDASKKIGGCYLKQVNGWSLVKTHKCEEKKTTIKTHQCALLVLVCPYTK